MKKNNKGFGRLEVLIMMAILLVIFAFIMYLLLQGANKQRVETMKENALNFSKTVVSNISSFKNINVVYLDEAIDEEVSKNIPSPFGEKYCDPAQSKVESSEGKAYVTLKCGRMLIKHAEFKPNEEVKVYEVSDWSATKPQEDKEKGITVEEATFYNCEVDGKEKYDTYYEDFYLVYKINKDFGTNYYFKENITNCTVKPKKLFRTLKEVK